MTLTLPTRTIFAELEAEPYPFQEKDKELLHLILGQ